MRKTTCQASRYFPPTWMIAYLLPLILATSAAQAEQVRIGLIRHFKLVQQVSIGASADFKAIDTRGRTLLTLSAAESLVLEPSEKGISVTRASGAVGNLGRTVYFRCGESDGRITVASSDCRYAEYRGCIEISSVDGKTLALVNELEMEDYLLGVLPAEMPDNFHIEALKAQTIAARTYAVGNRRKHTRLGYAMCDTVCCQGYIGATGEKETTSAAVQATRGMMLTYQGAPAHTFYCSDCGGHSERGVDAKGDKIPYLQSRPDRAGAEHPDFCAASSVHEWSKIYTAAEIDALLLAAGTKVADVKEIEVTSTNSSGRVTNVRITGGSQRVNLSGVQLRRALGVNYLKSTIFSVSPAAEGGFVFIGKGWGHGIGLCQHGANGMASPPYNHTFERILQHYYPGTSLAGK